MNEAEYERIKMLVLKHAESPLAREMMFLANELLSARSRIEELEKRLEITHCWQADDDRQEIVLVEVPPEERKTFPDGITARDSTIYLLEKALDKKNARIAELEKALTSPHPLDRAEKWHFSADEVGLLPCPHCGPGGSIVELLQDDLGYWAVRCGCCGSASGALPANEHFPDAKERIISGWNRRYDLQKAQAWQDIETAPNEGRVLVYGGRHIPAEIKPADGDWWRRCKAQENQSIPTHWMYPPDPPLRKKDRSPKGRDTVSGGSIEDESLLSEGDFPK